MPRVQPQQGGLATPPNLTPMLPGGLPFGGMPPPATNATSRLGAPQQFAAMGGGFPLNRAAMNANLNVLRGGNACASNGFGGMGGNMRSTPPAQGGMPMGNPYMSGMMGVSAGLQPHGGYGPSNDLLAMINKRGMSGMPAGMGEMGGGDVGSSQFDMAEFPALANRVAMGLQQPGQGPGVQGQGQPPPPPPGMHRVAAPGGLQQPEPEFAIQSEDFPALPGAAPKGREGFGAAVSAAGASSARGGLSSSQAEHDGAGRGLHAQQQPGLDLRHGVAGSMSQHMAPIDTAALLGHHQHGARQKARGAGSGAGDSAGGSALSGDPWSLLGLLSVIRMTDADLNYLALGTDLTSLGLNLNSPDCLYGACPSSCAAAPSLRSAALTRAGPAHAGLCAAPRARRHVRESVGRRTGALRPRVLPPAVLLHATTRAQDVALRQVPAGDALLHLLQHAARHAAGVRRDRAVQPRVAISQGPQAVVHALGLPERHGRQARARARAPKRRTPRRTSRPPSTAGARAPRPVPALPRSKGQYVFFDINAWEKKMFQGSHGGGAGGASAGSEGEPELSAGMDDSTGLLAHA